MFSIVGGTPGSCPGSGLLKRLLKTFCYSAWGQGVGWVRRDRSIELVLEHSLTWIAASLSNKPGTSEQLKHHDLNQDRIAF